MRGKAGLVSARVFPKVELLLHFDGTNGSTSLNDSSPNALSVTASNGAALSTSQAKFGTASLELDGADDHAQTASPQIELGVADFAIDFWFYARNVAAIGVLCEYNYFQIGLDPTLGTCVIYAGGNDGVSYGGAVEQDVWHHVAVTRRAETVRLFLDGAVVGDEFQSASYFPADAFRVGDSVVTPGVYAFNGFIDEFRIVKHDAVWVSNFTPPTSAY